MAKRDSVLFLGKCLSRFVLQNVPAFLVGGLYAPQKTFRNRTLLQNLPTPTKKIIGINHFLVAECRGYNLAFETFHAGSIPTTPSFYFLIK